MSNLIMYFCLILLIFIFFLLCYDGFVNVIINIAEHRRKKHIEKFYNQCPLYKQFLSDKQVFNNKERNGEINEFF